MTMIFSRSRPCSSYEALGKSKAEVESWQVRGFNQHSDKGFWPALYGSQIELHQYIPLSLALSYSLQSFKIASQSRKGNLVSDVGAFCDEDLC